MLSTKEVPICRMCMSPVKKVMVGLSSGHAGPAHRLIGSGDRHAWPALSSIAAVECRRTIDGKTSPERRYFISSHDGRCAQRIATVVRNHWRVETELHWMLDVCFGEDDSRVRMENAAENLSRVRRIALMLLKQEKTAMMGVKGKRMKGAYDKEYLLKVLNF